MVESDNSVGLQYVALCCNLSCAVLRRTCGSTQRLSVCSDHLQRYMCSWVPNINSRSSDLAQPDFSYHPQPYKMSHSPLFSFRCILGDGLPPLFPWTQAFFLFLLLYPVTGWEDAAVPIGLGTLLVGEFLVLLLWRMSSRRCLACSIIIPAVSVGKKNQVEWVCYWLILLPLLYYLLAGNLLYNITKQLKKVSQKHFLSYSQNIHRLVLWYYFH